ncbi:MAG TPA: hypothetical protein VF593_09840 [Chthoniobacteraceae bacterium]
MNRPDLDDLAALWQDGPDPLEQAQMDAYARSARRRGRVFDYLEHLLVVLLFAIFAGGLFVSTSPLTIGLGVPLIIVVTWLTWRRRSLRQMAKTLKTSDPAAFLESSLRNARANLRRNTIGLAFLPLVVPAAVTFKVSVRTGGGFPEVWEALVLWAHTPRAAITLALLTIMGAFTLRARRKVLREIEKLEVLRSGYELEAELERETGE